MTKCLVVTCEAPYTCGTKGIVYRNLRSLGYNHKVVQSLARYFAPKSRTTMVKRFSKQFHQVFPVSW